MLLMMLLWYVSDALLRIEPITNVANHFGCLGDQKGVFGWVRGCEIVGFYSAQMSSRSSERHLLCPVQNFARSLKQTMSERQANKNPTFVIWFAQAKFPSLKQNLPRTCSMWASLKRTPSEPQARNTQTFFIWLAQANRASLKRSWSWTTILCDFSKCS